MLLDQSVVCPVLIGRDVPLTTVVHTLDRARDAHGGALLVSGEAGVGKSRLVRAMIERARAAGFVTLQGACFEADRAQPYAPILDLIRVLSTTASPALAAHYFAPAAAELVTIFPELRQIFPDATPHPAFDPEEDRRRLFHSLAEAVHALGRLQPLLIVIEDVHWSDDATLDLVLHLARSIGTRAIALALSFRSDEVGGRLARLLADFDRARCAWEVSLRPLGVPHVAAMLSAIFGPESAFEPTFVGKLHALTEGNPFFVEEVLKALIVDGDLVHADGSWRARPLDHVRVPRTAAEAVGRRLAGLSEAAREVLSVAAVAGRRFDFELIKALTSYGETELLSLMKELVAAQFVTEESADRFAFRHALTREAIRTRLFARERVALHRAIATALERQAADSAQETAEALAYHTFEASDWESAHRYARAAAAHALTLGATREALQQLERAVTATQRLGRRLDSSLLIARGRAQETLGAFASANDDFVGALEAARLEGDRRAEWEALLALGMLWAARDYERAGRYRHEALEVARSIGEPALVARSLNRVGNWHINREDPLSGIPCHDEALAMLERTDDLRGIAETVDLLAMSNHVAGAQDAAVELYERSVVLFTTLGDRRGLANAFSVLVACGPSHHASAGPVCATARTAELLASERAVHLSTEIGWRAGMAFSRYLLADCLAWRGEYERALRRARESLAIAEDMEHLEWQCGARRVLGVIALDLHAMPEALAHLEAAYDIARRLASAIWIRWTAALFAVALARDHRPDHASAVLDDVDRIVRGSAAMADVHGRASRTLGERHLVLARAEIALAVDAPAEALCLLDERDAARTPRAAMLRAQALAALERWDEAIEWLGTARSEARAQEARPFLWRIAAAHGAVELAQRHRLAARQLFDEARAAATALVAPLDEPALVTAFHSYVDTVAPPPAERTPGQAAKAAYGGLTRRERDTAALVAQGKSNRAIARSLGIGERTVEGYVAAALSKLGFASRSQIAVWAAEQGLAGPEPGAGRTRR
ncbi:MAG TPA: AAA family ATPase [Gemmatimonadaceae bacterium]|nr:AAA family ATPase [Gemmatimonadaceae bacterium]